MVLHPRLEKCLALMLLVVNLKLSLIAAKHKVQKLVVNGVPVNIEQFPYTAQVLIHTDLGSGTCGGAIISQRVVATAAHCIYDEDFKKLIPAADFYIILGTSKNVRGDEYDACKIVKHPQFTKHTQDYFYDLGLILLTTKIKTSRKVQIATIANTDKWQKSKTIMTIAGFGKTSNADGLPTGMSMTRMKYVNRQICHRSQTPAGSPMPVPNHMFCMVGSTTTSDCGGDSGSPVTWGKFIVGLVSLGRDNRDWSCGSENLPSMYVDLTYFRKWINRNIKDLESISTRSCQKQAKLTRVKLFGDAAVFNETLDYDCLD